MEDIITDKTADDMIRGEYKGEFTQEQLDYLREQTTNGLAKFILYMYNLKDSKESYEITELLEESHNLKCIYATYVLGTIHQEKENFNRAFDYYTTAHVYGYVRATISLGKCYMCGMGVDRNRVRAKRLFQLAFVNGNCYGAFYSGLLEEHDGNIQEAIKWFKKAFKAGDSLAGWRIGMLTERDEPKVAVDYYTRAYENGVKQAGFHLAKMYKSGKFIDRDYHKANKLFKELVTRMPYASVELAESYIKGLGVKKNIDKGLRYYAQAVKIYPDVEIPKKYRKKLCTLKPTDEDYTKL